MGWTKIGRLRENRCRGSSMEKAKAVKIFSDDGKEFIISEIYDIDNRWKNNMVDRTKKQY